MYDSANPPFLTLSVSPDKATMFSQQDGYSTHTAPDDQILVGFRDGWTLPLSVQQNKQISSEPMLLIRDTGHITSAGSSFNKGFAHQFCMLDGSILPDNLVRSVFPDRPKDRWMLVPEGVAMVWLQYSYKYQSLGELGHDTERFYYGKLLIISLTICKDFMPRLDQNADNLDMRSILYRVEEKHLATHDWNTIDEEPREHLLNFVSSNNLERYSPAIETALNRALSY